MPSQFFDEMPPQLKRVSRQSVIELGTAYLHEIGSGSICKVCISNGGSCCIGCKHLLNGIGCQLRNTSCTAWLCGFLKYLLFETGLLQEWKQFWDQVPGQSYREDATPAYFFIDQLLSPCNNLQALSEALAADLQELKRTHSETGYISELRDNLNRNIDRLDDCNHNTKKLTQIKRKISVLSSPFHRFHNELSFGGR